MPALMIRHCKLQDSRKIELTRQVNAEPYPEMDIKPASESSDLQITRIDWNSES
jgi:hypothetical protein